jgi:5,10-methylenetetrahydromethanopterin reductase
MRFSVMIWPYSGVSVEPVVRLAQVAEDCGYDTVYVGDSQMIWNDVWITLAACALATKRVKLGPGVSNLITRHPGVTANAINTLNMLSGGRAVLGLGAGDSAVRTAGLQPSPLAELRERLPVVRALLDGDEVDVLDWYTPRPDKQAWGAGTRMRVFGMEHGGKDIPIQLACMQPKSAAVAGEFTDGVIVDGHMGGNAEGARATVAAVREGAERAGKDPSSVRIIAAIDAAVEDDRTKAIEKVRPTVARNIARKPWLPETLGVEHADVVKEVSESYNFAEHLDLTARHRELITEEVAQKCAIAGTPDDCVAKVRELEEAGITDIAVFGTSQDEAGSRAMLERFSRDVFPHV